MNQKHAEIDALIRSFEGSVLPPDYCCFFACFNRQWFFEAHEVLERLWLAERGSESADFYKGLIQLAGAFVHLQRDHVPPAASLFKLARRNLKKYPDRYRCLNRKQTTNLIEEWLAQLEAGALATNPMRSKQAPRLDLAPAAPRE